MEICYLDCVLLHSPLKTLDATVQAYQVLESYVPSKIRTLGISNVSLPIFSALYDAATVKPHVVQNRFYPDTNYDVALRDYCRQKGIVYQSFWTLTGNPRLLKADCVKTLAEASNVTHQIALYALVATLDVVVLNGTTNPDRMVQDLEGMERVSSWSEDHQDDAAKVLRDFKKLIGED
jgi:diketogulonate reductase-like aldo/keto reductase